MTVGGASATAFAPASVGNVAVGFDVLGLSVAALGDRVRAVRRPEPGVAIRSVTGVVHDLPLVAERNTAGMAVLAMQRSLDLPFGFDLDIEKGIPLGSGLGGSAASAVAGVVAAAALIDRTVPMTELLKFAMQGEAVASGAVHVDNIAPSLYGGLVLTVGIDNPHVKQIPVPEGVRCVVVHPHMMLATREARAILRSTVELSDVIWQQANLAGFLAGCYTSDLVADPRIAARRHHRAAAPGADPGFRRRQVGGDAGGCARLLDLRRGTERLRLGSRARGTGGVRGDGGRVRAARPRDRQLAIRDRTGRRARGVGVMQFESTRDPSHRVTLSTALSRGLAADGGLYVPERLPAADIEALQDAGTLPELALRMLAPFAAGDALETVLGQAASDAFSFPAPLTEVESESGRLSVLELFHGPTAAFKDFGARFLAAALERLPRDANRRFTVLVATSGDTGGAVAAAFYGRPWAQVVVLYPRGLVSARQQQQLAGWGGNVKTLSVAGTFDDCQGLVKGAFADPVLAESLRLSSANSINWDGCCRRWCTTRRRASCSPPGTARRRASSFRPATWATRSPASGRGRWDCRSATSCWRRTQIVPSSTISPAEHGNRRPSVATLASAMDVGNPSNLERLRWLDPDRASLRGRLDAWAVGDEEIRDTIRRDWPELGRAWCPHTATAACLYRRLPASRRRGRWVIVATAHPAKFDEIVEPLDRDKGAGSRIACRDPCAAAD